MANVRTPRRIKKILKREAEKRITTFVGNEVQLQFELERVIKAINDLVEANAKRKAAKPYIEAAATAAGDAQAYLTELYVSHNR